MKCSRKACSNQAGWYIHLDIPENNYCSECARRINKACNCVLILNLLDIPAKVKELDAQCDKIISFDDDDFAASNEHANELIRTREKWFHAYVVNLIKKKA